MIHNEKYTLQGNSGHKNTNMNTYRTDLSFMKQYPDTCYSFLVLVLVMTQSGPTHLVVLVVKNTTANAEDNRRGSNPCVKKIPWRRAWQPIPALSPGESHGQRSLTGSWHSPWGWKESDMIKWLSSSSNSMTQLLDFMIHQWIKDCSPKYWFIAYIWWAESWRPRWRHGGKMCSGVRLPLSPDSSAYKQVS